MVDERRGSERTPLRVAARPSKGGLYLRQIERQIMLVSERVRRVRENVLKMEERGPSYRNTVCALENKPSRHSSANAGPDNSPLTVWKGLQQTYTHKNTQRERERGREGESERGS